MEKNAEGNNSKKYFLIAGVMASIFVGIGKGLLVRLGFDKDLSDLLLMPLVIIILFFFFKERLSVGILSIIMLLVGLSLGFGYYYLFYLHEPIHIQSSNGMLGIIVYMINGVVLIPLFEEKVVRQLLFFGLSARINIWLAGIVVSTIFAVAHAGAMLSAFFLSIVMCILAARRIGTFNRAILHGCFNLALSGMWLYKGYVFG